MTEPSLHITPVVASFQAAVCSYCHKNRLMCYCGLPYPTKPERGLYGRQQYEADMAGVAAFDSAISRLVAAGLMDGLEALRQSKLVVVMLRKCKGQLMRTARILQSKDAAKPAQPIKLDKHNIRLSSSQQIGGVK